MVDKYLVLTTYGPGNSRKYSIVEQVETDTHFSRRPRLLTFIPDAGDENNAVRVARLLNNEYAENVRRAANREAALISENEKEEV